MTTEFKKAVKFLFSDKGAFLVGSVFAGFAWWINYVSTEYLSTPTLVYDPFKIEKTEDGKALLNIRVKNISHNYKFESVLLEFKLSEGGKFTKVRWATEGTYVLSRDIEKIYGADTATASYTLVNLHPGQRAILRMEYSSPSNKEPSIHLGDSKKAVRLLQESLLTQLIEFRIWIILFALVTWLGVVCWISYERRHNG